MTACAYIFLDEAGNFDFSTNGTRYFVLTSVSVLRPFLWSRLLDDYKYDCLEYGLDNEHFHCTEDNKYVRNRVFEVIADHLNGVFIDCLIVEKRKTGPTLRDDKRFYPEMLGYLLKYVLSKNPCANAKEVIIVTDTIPVNKRRHAIEKGVQLALAKMLPSGMKYRILHHDSRSHYGLQVADYCCWAVYRKLQTGEDMWFDRIRPAIRSEFNIFRTGKLNYY